MNGEVIFYDGGELSFFSDTDQDSNACQGK